ncbi:MAG: GtrA family protein [Pseudonocardiaceae bacterium]
MTLTPMRRRRVLLWGRYTAASVIAGVISEVVFVAAYWLGALPVVASLVAFAAGAVPNYLMNRYWAWQRSGKADRARETLPYAAIVIVTAAAAALITTVADSLVRDHVDQHALQVALVGAAFLGTYGFMFVLKFVLFDRFIFVRRPADTPETTSRP